jgi:hypothetical protein
MGHFTIGTYFETTIKMGDFEKRPMVIIITPWDAFMKRTKG